MTEDEYLEITDLTKIRMAHVILRDCMDNKIRKLASNVYDHVCRLEKKVRELDLEERIEK